MVDDDESHHTAELQGLIHYLEFLLGPKESRKPLVKTNVPSKRFSITPVTRKLADEENEHRKTELLLIKSSLSARFRPVEHVRSILEASDLPPVRIDAYVNHHLERVATQQQRIEQGRGRSIHEREFLMRDFQKFLPHLTAAPSTPEHSLLFLEANLLQGQILGVLRALKQNPNIHFALADQEFLIRFSLSGNTAFFSFDPPGAQGEPPFKRDDALVRAWTEHPDVVYQLRHEFNAIWKNIDPQWRTDNEQGRKNILKFFVTEPLKVLLDADMPGRELCSFLCELLALTSYLDREAFIREEYTYEQGAKEIVIFSDALPSITMPSEIGPWGPRSSVRTRQILFHALLHDIERIHLIIPQKRCEAYWQSGQYETHSFPREWVQQHFQHLHELLLKFPQKIVLDVVPGAARFPVSFEVINQKYVFFEKTEMVEDQGGIVLHDQELARKLLAYIRRNVLSSCSDKLQGAENVVQWIEKHFL